MEVSNELNEIKTRLKIVSALPAENEKLKGWIMEPEDCFGRGFDPKSRYCEECNVMSELDGRQDELSVFCRETYEQGKQEEKPKTTLKSKLLELKALRERKEKKHG